MILLPVFPTSSSKFQYTKELEETVFSFYFEWNNRSNNWYVSVGCDSEGYQIDRKKVIVNYPILNQNKALFPCMSGDIFIQKIDNTEDALGYDNFGVAYKVYYYTEAETASWKDTNGIQ